MIVEELPLEVRPVDLFAHLAGREGAVLLDCSRRTPHRRYSIIALSPDCTFTARGGAAFLTRDGKTTRVSGRPLDALKKIHAEKRFEYEADFPIGGAIGYIGYEIGHTLEKIRTHRKPGLGIPDCLLHFYDSLLVYDHFDERYLAVSRCDTIDEELYNAIKGPFQPAAAQEALIPAESIRTTTSRADFTKSVERIKDSIRKGDVYQVNLSQRFSAPLRGEPFSLYLRLRELSPVPHGAFLNLGGFHLLSLSPERFVRIKGRNIQTRPIKGTMARGSDALEDSRQKERLCGSVKDRAELLMITDLERNDLGRVCSPGSVNVPDLLAIEEYSNVFHLVSTIEGELAPGKDHVDCLAAVFPGGSITGAPKISAMGIIEELEPVQRNAYTGAIGYIGYNGQTDLNIAIRTATVAGGRIYFHGGGGIVIDSDPAMEYEETLHKVRPFFDGLAAGSYEMMLLRKEEALI